MLSKIEICDLLVDSCHSSNKAIDFFESNLDNPNLIALLYNIARDGKKINGDAPMQAAYYLSRCQGKLLEPYQFGLLEILPLVDGYGGHIALALAKTKLPAAKGLIINELGDGERFDSWLYLKALKIYEENS
jgi:hypothetical protein